VLGGLPGDKITLQKERNEGLDALNTLIKSDHVPFRKKMNWFTNTNEIQEFDSIDSEDLLKILWPKGAEMMF